MSAFVQLHKAGKIRAVGVSNFDPHQLQEAQDALGDVPLASTQPRYSLMNRLIEADVVPWLQEFLLAPSFTPPLNAAFCPERSHQIGFSQTTMVAQAIRSSASKIGSLSQKPSKTSQTLRMHTNAPSPSLRPHGASTSLGLRQPSSVREPLNRPSKMHTPLKSI